MLEPIAASSQTHTQAAPQPRLVRAAHEFEAQMMKELLKPLTAGSGLTGTDDDAGSNGALGDYAGEALARALSEAGGFGIANRIVGQVSHSGNQPTMAQVTTNQHVDTGVRMIE